MDIYTIGYGGRRPEELVALLCQRGVRAVCDVRLRPDRSSMGAFKLAKSPDKGIVGLLSKAGLSYVSLVELGNVFLGLDDWQHRYHRFLDLAGDLLAERLMHTEPPLALLCAEKRAEDCHRKILADYLVETKGCRTVEHIE